MTNCSILQKYNVPGPRYTSYPTVPYWQNDDFNVNVWSYRFTETFNATNSSEGISLYIHLPFCESLCTFCGCTKRITKNHKVEEPYLRAVLKEWHLYLQQFGDKPVLKEIHIGGGTPTFFSVRNLEDLINGIFKTSIIAEDFEFSFEGHPNNTTRGHLQKLYDLGCRRVSFGVQDYDPIVQKAINRNQPFLNVARATVWAKEIGYTSVGHDLIFGLPFQTIENVIDTIEKTAILQPDRIAFYSYAHTPWMKGNGQRGFKDEDIPKDSEKRKLYETGKQMLEENGYVEIGMDHFALPKDSLYLATKNNKLHRNFMGYNASKTSLMIGLGVSAISDCWTGFAQNTKDLDDYYQLLEWNQIPVIKGHFLNTEDLIVRQHILNLTCKLETSWRKPENYFTEIPFTINDLKEMQKDNLILIESEKIKITEAGKPFIRNVCMAFDLRMKRNVPETKLFSMTI